MKLLVAVVLAVLVPYSYCQAPSFCKGNECPKYVKLNSTQGNAFETRQYGPLTWATTTYSGPWHSNVLGQLFGRLFQYIQGSNTLKKKISMTVPVVTEVKSAAQGGTQYNMKFMIPTASMQNIPKPIDSKVTLITDPASIYYVRSFGGFANGQIYMSELQNLVNSINSPNIYDNNMFYTATYDSPSEKYNRHNEVWLRKL
ncbi:hypothetical protein LOTGIDRAFT_224226 [Lottia gigantea]|uniref:Heme-binding protein 2 n=1 Tax=Lottia gigantea TaxID=225164 RepID=V4AHP8_LOTGI|nr:hypothetical protein LOTGIDRAFT_224226 [Lottia gigantea]ESP03589.1 hypothetical protein LOTGIDRAFT_224226 [Lottia gigantea]